MPACIYTYVYIHLCIYRLKELIKVHGTMSSMPKLDKKKYTGNLQYSHMNCIYNIVYILLYVYYTTQYYIVC